jgi:tRNA dimethylallyltransferase
MKKLLVVIAGPTASGKTTTSIKLAKKYGSVILSADSRQFYRELNIGTAKPTPEEMQGIPHYFINSLSINDAYSVGDFELQAITLLDELFTRHDVVFVCGGTGLFIRALCNGLDEVPPADESTRKLLITTLHEKGIETLQKQLKELDPETYASIDQHNPQRLVRALEVCLATGKPFSSFKTGGRKKRNFVPLLLVLNPEREQLYAQINERVDQMIAAGLEEEARSVYPHKEANALQTVGYKEFFDYFDARISYAEAVEKIKQNTRNLAKRQLTWFRAEPNAHWFAPEAIGQMDALIAQQLEQ